MEKEKKHFLDRNAKRFLWWLVFVVVFFFLFNAFMKCNNERKFNNKEKGEDKIIQNSLKEIEYKDTLCISHNGSLYKDFGMSQSRALALAREVGLEYWYDDRSRLIVLVYEGDCFTVGWKKIAKN
jgi:hypothetical protein